MDDEATAQRRRSHARCRRAGEPSTSWPEFAPPVALSTGPLGVVQAADREIARLTALRARAVAEFAASRPASADRAQGEPGAMSPQRWAARPELLRPVSEWATQELQVALACTESAALKLLDGSLQIVSRLPGVLAALEGGALHVGHLWPMLDLVAPIADERKRAEIEAELLRWVAARAADRVITTPAQLRDKARRVVVERGARDAAQQLAKAIRERGIHLRGERSEGMAAVTAVLTGPEAEALYAALGEYADAVIDEPGVPPRSRAQKMADCLLDLVLRPGESGHPPVQLTLTLVAAVSTLLGGDAPGELNGKVVPAETVRQLLRLLAGADPAAATATDSDPVTDAAPASRPAGNSGAADGDEAASDDDPAEDPTPPPVHGHPLGEAPDRWWVDVERRLWAGADDEPDPVPPEQWIASAERALASGEVDLILERALVEVEERWWADVERGLVVDPDPPDDRWATGVPRGVRHAGSSRAESPCTRSPGTGTPPAGPTATRPVPGQAGPESGWWAAADRAVEGASEAALRAELALGHARRMVRTAETADAADEAAWRDAPAGRVDAAADALEALARAAEADRQALADLLARTAGGGLADRPRIALVDALTGALVSLSDLPEVRRTGCCGADSCRRDPAACTHDLAGRPGLGAPGPTDGYQPSAALDRFLRARDRRCRFPGCRRPVAQGELDHRVRYPDGPTAVGNLAGFCVGNHRGKHQAPGWSHRLDPDGTLTVSTPTGLIAATAPPPY